MCVKIETRTNQFQQNWKFLHGKKFLKYILQQFEKELSLC